MRNLRNLRFGRVAQADVTAACWDPETDEVICTVGPTVQNPTIQLLRVSEGQSLSQRPVTNWDAPSPNPDLPVDKILNIQYLSGTATICLVLEGGDIITVKEDQLGGEDAHIEIVGSIDDGISAARWSPDEELLVVVTKANNAIFMGSSLDPVAEVALTAEDLRASKHVSVGWGKKETQFQGRGAKALRDPTIPEKVDEGVPSQHENGATTISWRGDGSYVAINSVQDGSRRVIRVYSREGELDSASEPVDHLESSLSWRPSGNLMAGIQRLQDNIDVVFFERNGLRHGQFTLRSSLEDVNSCVNIQLEWNTDSTTLAVILSKTIQLWTMGNYHWYLKQEIPRDVGGTPTLAWHPERALRLAFPTGSGLVVAEQVLHSARGSCQQPYDVGAVAVIDGSTVKLTPFRTANVPPPMSFCDIETGSSAIDVAFGHWSSSFAILHHHAVDLYDLPCNNGRVGRPKLVKKLPLSLQHAEYFLPLRIVATSTGYRLFAYQGERFVSAAVSTDDENLEPPQETPTRLLSTATYDDNSKIEGYGQDSSGKLYEISATSTEPLGIQFPSILPSFETCKSGEGVVIAFGLSRNGHIYANSRQLAKNCTSFILTPHHLIFTTSNHFVKYVHLMDDVEELEVPGDDPEKDERCRSVERGSRLVTAMPTNMSIVLQMPRGNLETIYPRAMVLAGIRRLIDAKEYGIAFSYCRTQRVDMNVLCDYKFEQFLASVPIFLDQLNDISYIDLFLSSLKEEDVTKTMYQDTKKYKTSASGPSPEVEASLAMRPSDCKVNIVCDALLKSLQPRKSTNLQNIITAHVCKSPPALDDGLTLVYELMKEDPKVAEKAIEHICFLVDVNRLYENALGLYNLELTLLVAQQSQRDPREYLPFIQTLHALPELRRKFEIDDHLGHRSKALAHLQALDSFDEFCNYTTKHKLYQDALRLYRYDQAQLRTITDLYAAHLESMSSFREAGLAYESLQNYAKATSCYRSSGATCWQECLFSAQQQTPPLSAEAMSQLATALADALWEAKDYASAATIHAEYLGSLETAIKCLCKGYLFAEAMRLVAKHERPALLDAAVDAGLAEALGSTTEFLADCKAQIGAQVPRIAELRRKAAEDPLAFYEGDRAGGGDVPDDVSVAASSRLSTGASLFTRYTGKTGGSVGTAGTGVSRATSKNRRREEKKRARGRKGTVYEEEYLVNSTRRLVERVGAARVEVQRLVFALVRRGMAERARNAEALMRDVLEAAELAVAQVFPSPRPGHAETPGGEEGAAGDGEQYRAKGGDAVLAEWMEARSKKAEPPVLEKMSKLTLLG
ncbi:iki3 [Cordyceps fumosorosea ARSEF 2679]|uniref:Elongator complex protein 1 n=1 Tax=Cordyceps fumosorosea (strain ARSEF 2679) TaxID=1081104 RepID=A0A168B0W7_CORFA|nr:iki3 [Cordyceps fumosorosea ARSEF 2679]OAA69460.1 iki3 [Cordyceps fumosorosea ARSEF 2679]